MRAGDSQRVAHRGALAVLTTLLIGASLWPASRAEANFVSANSAGWTVCQTNKNPCMTNDSTFVVARGPMGPKSVQAYELAMWSSYDTTNLNVVAGTGDNGLTDVYFKYGALPVNVVGKYACKEVSGLGGWRCGHAHVRIDDSQTVDYDVNQMRTIFCHETGHAVGLLHGPDGDPYIAPGDSILACMRTPISPAIGLAAHNVAHINFHY